MKNIQVIDGARNCVYDIFAATEEEFALIFPADQDVPKCGQTPDRFGNVAFPSVMQWEFTDCFSTSLMKRNSITQHGLTRKLSTQMGHSYDDLAL